MPGGNRRPLFMKMENVMISEVHEVKSLASADASFTYTPASMGGGTFYIECRMCGYEPQSQHLPPCGRCPKCQSRAWHRLIRPHSLLETAENQFNHA